MTGPEIITALKDVILAIAAIVTASAAWIGVDKWKKELRGTARFDTARGLAKATYRLRDEIQVCRSPFIHGAEFPEGWQQDFSGDRNPQQSKDKHAAYVHMFSRRWEPVLSALQEFDAQALEAESLWGTDIRSKTDALRQQVRVLQVATEAYLADMASGGEDFKVDRGFGKEMREKVFASPSNLENKLSADIAAAVAAIEVELRRHMKRD